jgi:hypothetical protein
MLLFCRSIAAVLFSLGCGTYRTVVALLKCWLGHSDNNFQAEPA